MGQVCLVSCKTALQLGQVQKLDMADHTSGRRLLDRCYAISSQTTLWWLKVKDLECNCRPSPAPHLINVQQGLYQVNVEVTTLSRKLSIMFLKPILNDLGSNDMIHYPSGTKKCNIARTCLGRSDNLCHRNTLYIIKKLSPAYPVLYWELESMTAWSLCHTFNLKQLDIWFIRHCYILSLLQKPISNITSWS